jgi:N6-adenosine-specific RNA methylase IME4/ParB-like chromosome segregation protein Spo0J
MAKKEPGRSTPSTEPGSGCSDANAAGSTDYVENAQAAVLRPIAAIRVGERHRREMGDIESLARSIAEVGLLQPVVITQDGRLIAGERRLRAAQQLGWREIPVHAIDLDAVVRGEFAENACRKDLTISEAVAIKRALEPMERAAAKERQGERTDKHSEKFSRSSGGRALDKIANVVGKHRTTLAKAEAVVDAAAAEPEKFGKLLDDMDQSGRVDRAYKQLRIARARAEHASRIEHGCTVHDLVALAASGKRFGLILADPPWPFETWSSSGEGRSAVNHYPTGALEEIMRLPVAALAADDSALLIWGTWPRLPDVLDVIAAWGFQYKTCCFVWVKQTESGGLHTGMGYFSRSNSEFCLLATKGSPTRLGTNVHQVVMAPVGGHSAKLVEVRHRIERLLPGPYLELYARKAVPGWTVWGNEIPRENFAPMLQEPIMDAPGGDDLTIPDFLLRTPPTETAS